jgi:hypothetical protein
MSGLDAVDQIEARTRSSVASGRLTADGVKDDAVKFAMSNLVPALHQARTMIKKAKVEVAERRSRLKVEGARQIGYCRCIHGAGKFAPSFAI